MALKVKPEKATAVLLAGAGWQQIQVGSLKIDQIELTPPGGDPAAEDYGFAYKDFSDASQVTGRMSALLAVRE